MSIDYHIQLAYNLYKCGSIHWDELEKVVFMHGFDRCYVDDEGKLRVVP